MFCSNCGKQLEPEESTCSNCGYKLPVEKSNRPGFFAKNWKLPASIAGGIVVVGLAVGAYFLFRPKPVVINSELCTVASSAIPAATEEEATAVAGIPPVSDTDLVRGPETAALTIIEYSDYQCPYCAAFAPVVEQLLAEFPEDVRLVFRHFPLPNHPLSLVTVQAVEAAGLQGKYFEFSDFLLANQDAFSAMDTTAFADWVAGEAEKQGLNKEKFISDMNSDAIVQKAKGYQDAATQAGVSYTPFIMVNGRTYMNALDLTNIGNLRFLVQLFTRQAEQFTECPPAVLKAGADYQVTVETEAGNIVFDVNAAGAPTSANALVWLVQQGWYDNSSFYFVQRGEGVGLEYAITGDRTETGAGTPGFTIAPEVTDDQVFDQPGTVGFLNGGQLFFTFNAAPDLNGNYTVVGRIVEGQDVLEKLVVTTDTTTGKLLPGTKIIKVTVATR